MSYLLPPGERRLTGACAFADSLCVWNQQAAYRWAPTPGWTSFTDAPSAIDSGFAVDSGVLAGADTHVGFLPNDGTDWAWWADLSAYANAHPMYGDLLLCTEHHTDTTYHLFSISRDGLTSQSEFGADELATPVAGWSSPTNADRLLLLGDGGLWALDPPYTNEALQHLVSFDDVELPRLEEIPGPFQPGVAAVVIPRRTRTALRLELSDGTGRATGLKHLSGDAALWTAYLRNDRPAATRLLSALVDLPSPAGDDLALYDVLQHDDAIRTVATSAGLHVRDPDASASPSDLDTIIETLPDAPLNPAALVTWAVWLDGDDALEAACRMLCNADAPNYAIAESLRTFAGADACTTLFDCLRSTDPPTGPADDYQYPGTALRALVGPLGEDVAAPIASALSADALPARAAASAMAGARPSDANPSSPDSPPSTESSLWGDAHMLPDEALRTNAHHDHPAVRAAARDTCERLSIDLATEEAASNYPRRSAQSNQPESPK